MPTMSADTQVALFTDFQERYNQWFFAAQNANRFDEFCTIINSTTLHENLNFLESIPKYREWVDTRAFQAIGKPYSYDIINKHWEVTISVDRDTVFDNRLQLERQKIAHLGLEAGRAPWEIFINAALANGTCYDGVAMFATTHNQGVSGNQSNLLTGTGTTVSALTTDLGTAIAAMRNFLDGQGRPMNLGQKGLCVLAPPALEQAWRQVLHNDTIVVSTASGVFGAQTNSWKGIADLIIDPYLTDADDWYLFDRAEPDLPFLYSNREAPQFTAQDSPDSEPNFNRRMLNYGSDWRSNVGVGLWYLCVKVAAD